MLDAAVPGRVFASPHNRQVFEASLEVAGPSGVLHIVKNYTGDRINFGIAAERLRDRGIAVERVLVDDDIATESDDTATGRRGTAATFLIEKILGAAADSGLELAELAELGRNLAAKARSIAVASRAHTTMHGGQAFELAAGQLEYGVGIHGERAQQSIDAPDVRTLVARMVGELLVHIEPRGGVSDALLLLVNGLGATTQLELSAVAELAAEALDEAGAPASELCTGTFVPALNMSGFSLTLLPLGEAERGWWHAPCTTPAWRQS
jgi:dihydroxyacetone kinase